jgi:hypothetical protein
VRIELDGQVTVHRIHFPQIQDGEDLVISDQGVYWLGYSWTVLRELNRLLQAVPFDLINFPDFGAEGFAFQVNSTPANRAPVVVQLHGPLTMFAERIGWPDRDTAFLPPWPAYGGVLDPAGGWPDGRECEHRRFRVRILRPPSGNHRRRPLRRRW